MSSTPAMMAEFDSSPALLAALRRLRDGGCSRFDSYTPYEVAGLQHALGLSRSRLPWISLAAGLLAGGAAYALEWWINVVDYPLNIGGRPDHAAPAFIPIAFEMAILFASAAALISAIVLGGLPSLWHPVFEIDGFERASVDRFWLAVMHGDAALDRATHAPMLEGLALRVVWLEDAT